MVKYIDGKLSPEVFDFLGLENSAVLSCCTSLFCGDYSNADIAVQTIDDKTASIYSRLNTGSLLFTSKLTDFDELSFGLNDKLISPDVLPYKSTNEIFLLSLEAESNNQVNECRINDIPLNLILDEPMIERKRYLYSADRCKASAVLENDRPVSFGLLSYDSSYCIISDVYTLPEYRKQGFASKVIADLISLAPSGKIYTLCEKSNLSLYQSLGFSVCKTIKKYEIKGNI